MKISIKLPLDVKTVETLRSGDEVLISGYLYVARDTAHKRFIESLEKGDPLPFELKGQTIYYMGPTPARPGQVIGSAGPTTSGRMDVYTPRLLAQGLKGMIGKGARSKEVREAIKKYKAVYFAAVGGAGALVSKTIKSSEVVAYEDLGAEALRRILVEGFQAFVVNDIHGGDIYREGREKYRRDPNK